MKCPFCQQELHIFKSSTQDAIVCADCGFDGNTKLWQEFIDLMKEYDLCYDALIKRTKEVDRTRKALDVAVKALERLDKELYFNNAKQTNHIADSVAQIPGVALDQIKKITETKE